MTQIIPNTQAVPQVIGSSQVVVNGTNHQWLANEIMHGVKVLHVGDYSFSAEETGGGAAELKLSLQRDIGSGWEDMPGEGAAMTFVAGQDRRFRTLCKVPYYDGIDAGVLPKYRLVAECPAGQVTLHTAEGSEGVPSGQWKAEYEFEGEPILTIPTVLPFPDTGQTIQYAVGDDADYGFDATEDDDSDGYAGFSYTKLDSNGDPLASSAPSWEYVKDNRSGLIYKTNIAGTYTWDDAASYAAGATDLGKTWRIPSIRELCFLANYESTNPCVDSNFIELSSPYFRWSSTERFSNPSNGWLFGFNLGDCDPAVNKANEHQICIVSGDELLQSLVDNGDGTITDQSTGLMWTKSFHGSPSQYSWVNATSEMNSLSLAGHTDWRLPNIKELLTIARYDLVNLFDPAFFDAPPAGAVIWTSTTKDGTATSAWALWLTGSNSGFLYYIGKTTNYYCIGVRNIA